MPHPQPARSYKVLVVEDEGLIAHDISNRLEALGHQVTGTVSTAGEALAQAPDADIILMDIHIDGERDGIEAATEIRSRFHLPVIFLTAHADRSTLDRAKLAGPFGYIVKPLGPASLHTGIEMAIAKHRVERLLEERETWLRSTLACIADAAVVTDAAGRVRLLNGVAERLTGWTQAEADGQAIQKIVRLIEKDSNEEEFDFLPVALLRDAPMELDRRSRMISRDGRELEIEGYAAPVRAGNELLGAVITFRDASARRWEERQLRQAQRLEAAGRLAASASNEYTNLIAIIRKQTEHLLAQFGEYSPARGALEEIQQAAVAADKITRRLAAFGTRQVGHPEVLNVNNLLRRLSRLIESIAGDRISVAIRPSPGAGQIRADLAQMESAIMNLAGHACAAMSLQNPEAGQLLIETARLEIPNADRTTEYVLLTVTYSVVEPDIDGLFDPEATADAGLALAMIHSMAAECGGFLSASSGRNGGSRIEMLIPRVSDQALLPLERPGAILLVDGRHPVRAELHNFFEAAGYNLLEAADVAEAAALAEMREGSLDLIIADENESTTLLRDLRASHPTLQALRIVEHAEQSRDEIRTPFTRQALLDRVSALVNHPASVTTSHSALEGGV